MTRRVKLLLFLVHVLLLLKFQQAAINKMNQDDDIDDEEDDDTDNDLETNTDAEVGCDILENRHWKFVCNGIYSRELKLKYKDRIVNEGVPYRVWHDQDSSPYSRLLIAFYESKLFACRSLRFINDEFYCDDKKTPLKLPNSELHCLPFIYSYADNLRERCQHASRRVRATASAIQYTRISGDGGGAATASLKRGALLIFLLHFAHFRFRFRFRYAI